MSYARYIVGDALEELKKLPDASVDLVLTSPPFLALRSYLPSDDPRKPQEMGSEATPGQFIDRLLDVVEECRRVLAPHGSLVLELGDTYAGSGGAGGDYNANGFRDGQAKFSGSASKRRANGVGDDYRPARAGRSVGDWPLEKSLTLVPELLRISLAYGVNPLTGRETQRWRIRNVVRWVRPNPPVGALADKFRPATSDFVVACMSRKRYFDMHHGKGMPAAGDYHANGGAPPLDWLLVSTEPYKGSHYATWPKRVVLPFIEVMCPRKVCMECGSPSQRIVETTRMGEKDDSTRLKKSARLNGWDHPPEIGWEMERRELGFTDCGHNAWRRGLVLDLFAGSGVTLAVAVGLGRDAIGIDLDVRNLDLARERVGMFLEEVTT